MWMLNKLVCFPKNLFRFVKSLLLGLGPILRGKHLTIQNSGIKKVTSQQKLKYETFIDRSIFASYGDGTFIKKFKVSEHETK